MTEMTYKRGPVIFLDWRQRETGPLDAGHRVLVNLLTAIVVGYVSERLGAKYGIGANGVHELLDDVMDAFKDHPELINDGVVKLRARILMDLVGMEIHFFSVKKTLSTVLVAADPDFIAQVIDHNFLKFAKSPFPDGESGRALLATLTDSNATIDLNY